MDALDDLFNFSTQNINDACYLFFVKQHPCCITKKGQHEGLIEAYNILELLFDVKNNCDYLSIPLCSSHRTNIELSYSDYSVLIYSVFKLLSEYINIVSDKKIDADKFFRALLARTAIATAKDSAVLVNTLGVKKNKWIYIAKSLDAGLSAEEKIDKLLKLGALQDISAIDFIEILHLLGKDINVSFVSEETFRQIPKTAIFGIDKNKTKCAFNKKKNSFFILNK